MKVIIIEDEKPAIEKLKKGLRSTGKNIEVLAELPSVESAVDWLTKHSMPDLIFMDIELSDGLSFQIFEKTNISCPIIFITAFDDYWQTAFEKNGIDYLLKPFRQEKLNTAIEKYTHLQQHFSANLQSLLSQSPASSKDAYKKRFLVKRGIDFVSIRIEEIAYFYATHKLVCMVDQQQQKFVLDESLAEIESQVDPALFYRVNRKFLVSQNAIRKIQVYPKSKLLLELNPSVNEEVIISQENTAAFKKWMGE